MNLKAFLSVIALVPQLFTLVDSVVQSIETSLSGLSGSEKLAAAEAKVNAILSAAESDASVVTAIAPMLTTLIASSVAMFNAAGIFKHKTAAASP